MSQSFIKVTKNFNELLLKPEEIDLTNDEMKVLMMKSMDKINSLEINIEELNQKINKLDCQLKNEIMINQITKKESIKESQVIEKKEEKFTQQAEESADVYVDINEKNLKVKKSKNPKDKTGDKSKNEDEKTAKIKKKTAAYITICSSAASSGLSNYVEDTLDSSGKKAALFGVEDDVQKIDKLFKNISSQYVKYLNKGNYTFYDRKCKYNA